jgi:hypothetical protein
MSRVTTGQTMIKTMTLFRRNLSGFLAVRKIAMQILLITVAANVVSCSEKQKEYEDERLLTTSQMEIELQEYYQSIEAELRADGQADSNIINRTMQIMIDDKDIPQPYVYKYVGGLPKKILLNYLEYKEYRRTHAIDTAERIIYYDSIKN